MMKRLITFCLLCAAPAWAQPLTLLKKLSPAWIPEEAASTATSTPRPGDPSAGRGASPLAEVTQHTALWGVPGGEKRAVFQRNLGVYDETLEEFHVSEPELWTTAAGHVMLDGQVRITLETVAGASVLDLSKTVNGVPQGYSLTLPLMELVVEEPGFSYRAVASNLRLKIFGTGFGLYTNPLAQQRSTATPYTFPYTETGIELQVQPDGSLGALPLWQLTRARMIGANTEIYLCGPWVVGEGDLSFTCDDTALPPEAFPYIVDPTGVFEPQATEDDGHTWGNSASSGAWPPAVNGSDVFSSDEYAQRNLEGGNTWRLEVSVLVLPTGGLPDAAVIESATLNFFGIAANDTDGWSFAAEYWDTAGLPIDQGDYVTSISGDAIPDVSLATLPGAGVWNTFSLINLGNILKTADTGFRMGVNGTTVGAEPTGLNRFIWDAYGNTNPPYLEVVYDEETEKPPTFQIISTDDDD